jgi:catechol 2,3-dioxygenase-like lactoylglutathione lyase family enzyme
MPLRTGTTWFGVVLDSTDARALARFYADLLGWQIFNESDTWVDLAPSEDAGYNFAFATDPLYVPPVWPTVEGRPQMSMHLDLEVDDLAEGVAYALSVGARLAEFQPQEHVRVLLDPAGHPFCLYTDNSGDSAGGSAADA